MINHCYLAAHATCDEDRSNIVRPYVEIDGCRYEITTARSFVAPPQLESTASSAPSSSHTLFVLIQSDINSSDSIRILELAGRDRCLQLTLLTGKRDHPREYWSQTLIPECIRFCGENIIGRRDDDVVFCFDATAAEQPAYAEAAAVLAIAVVLSRRGRRHRQPRSRVAGSFCRSKSRPLATSRPP